MSTLNQMMLDQLNTGRISKLCRLVLKGLMDCSFFPDIGNTWLWVKAGGPSGDHRNEQNGLLGRLTYEGFGF